jgi:hypothetical protein
MNKSSLALIGRGISALGVGVIAVVWTGITVGVFVLLFAIYAFIAAGSEAARALRPANGGVFGLRACPVYRRHADVSLGVGLRVLGGGDTVIAHDEQGVPGRRYGCGMTYEHEAETPETYAEMRYQ